MNSKGQRYDKLSSRQPIRGHLMKLKQFNHPVHCAMCHGFIWFIDSFLEIISCF